MRMYTTEPICALCIEEEEITSRFILEYVALQLADVLPGEWKPTGNPTRKKFSEKIYLSNQHNGLTLLGTKIQQEI